MSYKSIMVRMSVRGDDDHLLRFTASLASYFDAELIGIAVYPAMPQMYSVMQVALGSVNTPDQFMTDYREAAQKYLDDAEARFTEILKDCGRPLSWRTAITDQSIPRFLAQEARVADLFVTNPFGGSASKDSSPMLDVGEIVMNIGRPELVVPAGQEALNLDTVLIGWKDTRATRRAVFDAIPFLKRAKQVIVAQIAPENEVARAERICKDVGSWLARHGVETKTLVTKSTGGDANRLAELTRETNAGLLVAGAYGHARIREWALGGVTADLLLHPTTATLISH